MKIKLRQAFDLQMGKTPARNRPDYWNGDHKWISIADIGNAGKFLTKTKESITAAGIDGSGIKVVPQGTVIMSFKLSIGKTAITSEDMYTNEAIMAFIDNGKFAVDTNYLYHLCCGTNWTAGTNKAVMGLTLNKATLLEKEIPLPDINEQHEIATKLDKIDALIAERQQQLELIDQAVKSRFIELFGDADRFEAAPLDDNVEEMFIGPFGSSLKNECFVAADQGYCMVYEQKHAIKKTMEVDTRYIDEKKYKELRRFTVQGGDIIVSCRGTIGETFIIPDGAPFGIMHPSIMKIRLKAPAYNRVFFNHLLQTVLERHEAEANGSGVKMAITATALGKEHFILPPMELQEQFAAFVEQTDKSKLAVQKGLQELEILKKSLMQQYFG